jgi:hypothetical protein
MPQTRTIKPTVRVRQIHLPALIGFLVVIAAATVLVASQPVTSPWWIYADADGTYSGSALSILAGHGTDYFDHPGLPEQELLAVSFGVASLAHGGPTQSWAADEMIHLDRARPIFRGWAITFFIGGAALAFFLLKRLLGHWTWGTAGGLLWLAQPDLTDSIQIRPDVLLAALALVVGFFAVRALERRSPLSLILAAVVLGFTLMVKLHSVALLATLLIASVLGYPGDGWPGRLRVELRDWLSRHRVSLGLLTGVWVALALAFNLRSPTPQFGLHRMGYLLIAVIAVLAYLAVSVVVRIWIRSRLTRRIADPLFAVLALAIAFGMFISVGLLLGDGLSAVQRMVETLEGGGVNAGITPFKGLTLTLFNLFPLRQASGVFVLAGIATIWGVRQRNAWPAVWFAGAAVAGVMATARLGGLRYFALPYVLTIPPCLWLFRRRLRPAAPVLVWILVAYVLFPTFQFDGSAATSANGQEAGAASMIRVADRVLKPGEVALVPDQFPLPDDRWTGLVENFTPWHPNYPYRFIDDEPGAPELIQSQHLHLRYFIGQQALTLTKPGPFKLASGVYQARPVPGSIDPAGVAAVELVSGPGI